MPEEAKWYVVHTYSGYENKVKLDIEMAVENRGMENLILEVAVPMQNTVEVKDGKKRLVEKKVFPGYVLVKMIMTDETWYVVRNTRGVTSFVGPGSKPVPLTEDEILNIGMEQEKAVIDLDEGQKVRLISGPFSDSIGEISEVNQNKQTVTVILSIFGRDTPVEIDFTQVETI